MERYRNNSVDSGLKMYEFFYLGDENTGTITGQNNSHVSSHVFIVQISEQFELEWTFGMLIEETC